MFVVPAINNLVEEGHAWKVGPEPRFLLLFDFLRIWLVDPNSETESRSLFNLLYSISYLFSALAGAPHQTGSWS